MSDAPIGPRGRLVDAFTAPGSPERANEDAFGHAEDVVWVIDGATGLGDAPLTDAPTDATWLARAADEAFAARVRAGEREPFALMNAAAADVAERFRRERLRAPEHRYEIPTAAVLIARFGADAIEVAELGDTRLYVLGEDGALADVGGVEVGRDLERENAARLVKPGDTIRTPEVLAHLRSVRDLANTEGGYWVFAADPEPACRARRHRVPLGAGRARALLLTDGLDAIVANYGRLDPAGLALAAAERGIARVVDEIRRIEREEDPDRIAYPRFKRSDDATGVLVEIAPRG